MLVTLGKDYARLRVRLHGHKHGEEDGMRSRTLVCKCLRMSQFKSAIERYTKRKKYFRFVLVVPARTIQQPRDTRGVPYSEIRFTDLPWAPFVSAPFPAISLLPVPSHSCLFIVQHAQFNSGHFPR